MGFKAARGVLSACKGTSRLLACLTGEPKGGQDKAGRSPVSSSLVKNHSGFSCSSAASSEASGASSAMKRPASLNFFSWVWGLPRFGFAASWKIGGGWMFLAARPGWRRAGVAESFRLGGIVKIDYALSVGKRLNELVSGLTVDCYIHGNTKL